jgi:hypothetical protein
MRIEEFRLIIQTCSFEYPKSFLIALSIVGESETKQA